MKTLYVLMMIGFLVMIYGMPYSVADEDPWIAGYVRTEDTIQPINDLEIAFTNERTSETIYATTNVNGHYQVDLDDFTDWETADKIFVDPEQLDDYYVCHPTLYLGDVQNYQYNLNLWGTPIPNWGSGYAQDDAGSMWVTNRLESDSGHHFNHATDDVVVLDKLATGVDICFSPSYSDDGSGLVPGRAYTVRITYDLWAKCHDDIIWPDSKHASTVGSYTIDSSGNVCGNPVNPANLIVSMAQNELLSDNADIRIAMHVSWDSGNWDYPESGEIKIENINYRFSG